MNPWLDKLWKFVKSELFLDGVKGEQADQPKTAAKSPWARRSLVVAMILVAFAMSRQILGFGGLPVVPEINPGSLMSSGLVIGGSLLIFYDRFVRSSSV